MRDDTLEKERLRHRITAGTADRRDMQRAREVGLRGIRRDSKTGRVWDDGTSRRGDWERDRGES